MARKTKKGDREGHKCRRFRLPPHLVDRDGEKLCSACGVVIPADAKPSLSKAFVEHVRQVHNPAPKPDEKKPSQKAHRGEHFTLLV